MYLGGSLFWTQITSVRWQIVRMGLLDLAATSLFFLTPLLVLSISDHPGVLVLAAALAGTLAVHFVLARLRAISLARLEQDAGWTLRRRLLQRFHELPLEASDRFPPGGAAQRVIWLGDRVEKGLESLFARAPQTVAKSIVALIVLTGFLGAKVLLLALLASGLSFAAFFFLRYRRVPSRENERLRLKGRHLYEESFEGIKSVRSLQMGPFLQRRFDEKQQDFSQRILKTISRQSRQLALVDSPWVALTGALLVLPSLSGLSTVGVLLAPVAAALLFLSARECALHAEAIGALEGSLGELELLLNEREWTAPLVLVRRTVPKRLIARRIIVESASQKVGPIDLVIAPGKPWILTGGANSGKSLLLETLAGVREPASGEVRLSGAPGEEGALVPEFAALVEQGPFLFEGSLRENLVFGNSARLSDTQVWSMLEKVGLYDFARKGGLEGMLMLRGQKISRGIRYRIALSRALLLQRPFLFLDEPFSQLDDSAISGLVKLIHDESQRTGIVIATRFVPFDLRDPIVTEVGPHPWLEPRLTP